MQRLGKRRGRAGWKGDELRSNDDVASFGQFPQSFFARASSVQSALSIQLIPDARLASNASASSFRPFVPP